MKQEQPMHKPKQKRSELTKEKILDTARKLFCEKGYYQVSFSNHAVAELLEKQQIKIEDTVFLYFEKFKDQLKVQDLQAAVSITFTLINAVVDQIVFSKNRIDRERLLTESVNAVKIYLFGA